MELTVNETEANVLREVLDGAWRDLRVEIGNTDNAMFKERLREREAMLHSLLNTLGGPITEIR